ncbi:MAG: LysR substrate-binding domain-containing protein [Pseudomonadota bacterium]
MDIRQLRYFVSVVDAGSITRAAHQLHVVQSAISHQIGNLEEELGAVLLARSHGGVVPTEAGRLLYRHAQAALKNLEAAKQAITSMGVDVRGAVTLGIPNSIVPLLALPFLTRARHQFPHVEITLYEGLSAMHREMLANGKLDFAVLFESAAPAGIEITPLLSERLHFVCADAPVRAAFAGRPAVSLSEVAQWPLLLPPRPNGIRALLERECQMAGLELKVAANLSGVQTIWSAVRAGLGSSVIMAANVDMAHRDEVLLLPIRDPEMERPACVAQLVDLPLTHAAFEMKQLLVRTARELISAGRWPGASLIAGAEG